MGATDGNSISISIDLSPLTISTTDGLYLVVFDSSDYTI